MAMKLKNKKLKTPLDRAVAEFERMFGQVVEYDPRQPKASHAPNGMPYRTVMAQIIPKNEGEAPEIYWTTADVAVAIWLECAKFQADGLTKNPHKPTKILYWRERPSIMHPGVNAIQDTGQFQVYSRFIIDG